MFLPSIQSWFKKIKSCFTNFFHSDVLYPKDTCSPISGVPADILCRGRDYVVSNSSCFTSLCCILQSVYAITAVSLLLNCGVLSLGFQLFLWNGTSSQLW